MAPCPSAGAATFAVGPGGDLNAVRIGIASTPRPVLADALTTLAELARTAPT